MKIKNGGKEVAKRTASEGIEVFEFWVETALQIEKLRIAVQARQDYFRCRRRDEPAISGLLSDLKTFEKRADRTAEELVTNHPTYRWLSRVDGIGRENIAKILGLIKIERFPTIISLWEFLGLVAIRWVDSGDEKIFEPLALRCRRLGFSLLHARGKFYDFYVQASKLEPPGFVDQDKAFRRMLQLFFACLWIVWRDAMGLSTQPSQEIQKLDLPIVPPWDMTGKGSS